MVPIAFAAYFTYIQITNAAVSIDCLLTLFLFILLYYGFPWSVVNYR